MLHVWVLDDMKFTPDVFAGHDPVHLRRHRHPRPERPVPHVAAGGDGGDGRARCRRRRDAEKGVTLRASDTASGRIQYICFAGA